MHSLSQKLRPKHQVLILKCYPRTTKGAVDVKPNSSELSYLLYYATSRRSKIQKVGNFLERKTASDVWRLRIGNVQVTLQILEALIEKNPKDLPLFAPNVLKILDAILRSSDITMVESSIPTFEAFCANHDASTLLADQVYLAQFEAVVRHYATLASTRSTPGKGLPSKPVAMRWRQCGLEAIRAVAASDALSSIASRQYDLMIPMILENLWTDNEEFLDVLLQRADAEEIDDTDRQLKRRNSTATVRTADTAGDTNPIALSGTAMDVDKLAEQDIGVIAMLCLKQIFITPSRSLIHYATMALLDFIKDRIDQGEAVVYTTPASREGGWSVKICRLLLHWAPVQERYIILITLMDALARTPLSDASLEQHIALTTMIGSLLRSDESLIGLSVMDMLLGFIQQIKKLVQMPGDPAATAAAATAAATAATDSASAVASKRAELLTRLQQCIGDLATHVYYADQISDMVAAILFRLKPPRSANGNIIGDNAAAAAASSPGEKAASTDDGKTDESAPGTAGAAGSPSQKQGSPQHSSSVDSLFSLTVAKTAVLRAVKAILLVANPKTKLSGNQTLSRNRVPIQVWEGTHWLLRDADGQVRKAYVDALLVWLDREVSPDEQRARDETTIASPYPITAVANPRPATRSGPSAPAPAGGPAAASSPVKRAVSSSTSNRETASASGAAGAAGAANAYSLNGKASGGRKRHVFFLSLLHLAIFDNALQYVDYETDIVLLHILLYKLVEQLGVNATRYGLPMIFQLQEAIQDVETPQSKVRVGSLVHGYFWTLTEKFNFETTMVGHAIRNEVTRRRTKHFWVDGVHVPPPLLESVGTPGTSRSQPRMAMHQIETEALLPFDDRLSLVENICSGYHESAVGSAPASPGGGVSPSKGGAAALGGSSFTSSFNFAISSLSSGGGAAASGTAAAAAASNDAGEEVPAAFKDQMLSDWSRDGVLQAVQQLSGSKSESLSGSRTGTWPTGASASASTSAYANANANTNASAARQRLALNTSSGLINEYLYSDGGATLSPSASQSNLRGSGQRAATSSGHPNEHTGNNNNNNNGSLAPLVTKLRKSSVRSGLSPSPGDSLSSKNGGAHNGAYGHGHGPGAGFVTSVDQLKMALSGAAVHAGSSRQGNAHHGDDGDDGSTDSLASYDISVSEFSFNPPQGAAGDQQQQPTRDSASPTASAKPHGVLTSRKSSGTSEFLTPSSAVPQADGTATEAGADQGVDDSVPPVPPLPSPIIREQQLAKDAKVAAARRNVKSRGSESILSSVLSEETDAPGADLQSLLQGIDGRTSEHGLGNLTRPPY